MMDTALFDSRAFDAALTAAEDPLPLFRRTLKETAATLEKRFWAGERVTALVTGRARFIDNLLRRAWRLRVGERDDMALVAVGGYGRGELHPHSDIDLMVLVRDPEAESIREPVQDFLTFLWDMGLEVGHSLRGVEDCIRESERDITVATNMMESRLLTGPADLYRRMKAATGPDRIWPSRDFFEAKWQEQIERHHKFHDTGYNLEPNVKEGPGGLRDIQMVGWVAKRHFNAETLSDLVEHGFLTAQEYKSLIDGQSFLWKVRFGLHILAGRREDRLLFDHQRNLASRFGYRDKDARLAVEHFMKRYYRTVMEQRRLNEMLLQLFQEVILYTDEPGDPVPINRRFQSRKGFVEVTHHQIFERYPFALLEIFLVMAQNRDLKGVRAETIRLIRNRLHLIDNDFRNDLRCRSLFMEFLRQPRGITHELRRMNRYGVLGAYLPAFGRIVGQMQHDLFHVYTVDEHSLFVVRNLRRLTVAEFAHEFPFCTKLIRRVPKPEILYIAALFHDIAKGRGGDHSELGAEEVTAFCRHHLLGDYDTRLAAWLVRNHLLMSTTAQRKDISDPNVVNAFASVVRDRNRLDYLYLLTVADIRGTSPSVWNSWKEALLTELYHTTRNALRRGLANPLEQSELATETRQDAWHLLEGHGIRRADADALWRRFGEDYFVRYSADEIVWHARALLGLDPADIPLILTRQETHRGGTEIFIHAKVHDRLFALVTTVLDQMGLDIADARIISSRDGYTLDTYIVLDEEGEPIANDYRLHEIVGTLRERLRHPDAPPPAVERQLGRQLKHFRISTEVSFSDDLNNERTIMEVVTSDRPGLLSQIGQVFAQCEVRLQNAKIATFGERVEDFFFITDANNNPLREPIQFNCLREGITRALDH